MDLLMNWKKLVWQSVMMGMLWLMSSNSFAQVPLYMPTNNLIGYWPLNGNFQNAHSTLHNGTNNGAIPAQGRDGANSTGMRFNGLNQFATLPSSVMSQVTGPFTVSVWLKADSVVPNNLGYEPINDRTGGQWNFRFRLMFGQMNFGTYSPDSAYMDHINASGALPRAPAPYPNPDAWVHYVMVYSGTAASGVMQVYHNGTLRGVSPTTNLTSGARAINLGRGLSPSLSSGYGFFGGVMDDIAVWNRALTASEIMTIYQSCQLSTAIQPTNQSVTVGGTATFAVTPASSTANIQWQMDTAGQWITLFNGPNITGVNSNALSLTNVGFNLNGAQFRAFITDSACTGTSNVVNLTVSCSALVNQSPASANFPVGGTATFVAGATIAGVQYQWQSDAGNGFQNILNFGQFSGVNTNTLTISNLSRTNNGFAFRCLISYLGCTQITQVATLGVLCNALINQQPTDFNGTVGGNATFSVSQVPGATYSWYVNSGFNFTLLANGGQYSGATSANLNISNLALRNNNEGYICIVTNEGCSDTSAVAILRVSAGTNTVDLVTSYWRIYPNPANNYTTLDLSEQLKPVLVQIHDMAGRRCFEAQLAPGKHALPVGGWRSGVYTITVGAQHQRLILQGQ
ncbi:MAG: hypothetical protein C0424_10595 [Sphingobacteriaceae bacterium]|nr:hypothetical protein [Sphingobacteriaceae bacterium]